MPWWANFAWCGVFVALLLRPRLGVGLGAAALTLRVWAVASSVGTLWMLSGFGWIAVLAFYALTALWPVLLVLLWRGKGNVLAGWMLSLAVLEGVGPVLGARFALRPVSAAMLAIGQVAFLHWTARDS